MVDNSGIADGNDIADFVVLEVSKVEKKTLNKTCMLNHQQHSIITDIVPSEFTAYKHENEIP